MWETPVDVFTRSTNFRTAKWYAKLYVFLDWRQRLPRCRSWPRLAATVATCGHDNMRSPRAEVFFCEWNVAF